MPRHLIDEIRERTDLVELVQRHVRLNKRGNSYVGLCPFHQEKTPSFHVVPNKHLFHCFGCGAGGDCFKLLMELEGVSFIEAVKELATGAGVDLPSSDLTPEQRRALRERASLYDVLDAASQFYQAVLMSHPDGAAAREYLKGRGITAETALQWRLGFAPGGWTTTIDVLQKQGFPPRLLDAAGLAKTSDNGRRYDTFRDRITIPITDERGRILAFGARLMKGDGPKYLNSPETALYTKSNVLFGMQHARQSVQRNDRALLVEGYFDVISLHQAGFPEAIATCGTALTEPHLETLRRLTKNVVALFDADEAGGRAAEKSLPLFIKAGVLPWRLQIPGAKDPDEFVRESGAEAMETALTRRQPLLEWVIDRRLSRSGGGSAARELLVEDLVGLLALTDGTEIISRVSARLKVHEVVLQERVARARRQAQLRPPQHRDPMQMAPDPPTYDHVPIDLDEDDPGDAGFVAPPRKWAPTRDMVHLLWLLVHRYDQVAGLLKVLGPVAWEDQGPAVSVFAALLEGQSAAALLADIDDEGVRKTLAAVVARQTLYTEPQAASGCAQVLFNVLGPLVEQAAAELSQKARAAAQARDWDQQELASGHERDIRKQLATAKSSLKANEINAYAEAIAGALSAATALL
ncbi:MAG: DNA primase [Myxococcota bacterium]